MDLEDMFGEDDIGFEIQQEENIEEVEVDAQFVESESGSLNAVGEGTVEGFELILD